MTEIVTTATETYPVPTRMTSVEKVHALVASFDPAHLPPPSGLMMQAGYELLPLILPEIAEAIPTDPEQLDQLLCGAAEQLLTLVSDEKREAVDAEEVTPDAA